MGGKCLAHVLADRQTVGQRPVTLIGHSMGARLLVYCLCELYDMGEFHVVDDVVLLGTPVTTEATKWQKAGVLIAGLGSRKLGFALSLPDKPLHCLGACRGRVSSALGKHPQARFFPPGHRLASRASLVASG
ncbi:unnamed protein product [Effrenium voratum]|nr:unnamed protein product [Effrenium voratum]